MMRALTLKTLLISSFNMKFLFFFLLGSCALFKMDENVPRVIKENKLAGKWASDYGHFSIWCKGSFEYHEPLTWNNMDPKNSEKGGHIMKFDRYSFKTGPFLGEEHDINRMPYQNEKGEWMMDMDGKQWKQVEGYRCED